MLGTVRMIHGHIHGIPCEMVTSAHLVRPPDSSQCSPVSQWLYPGESVLDVLGLFLVLVSFHWLICLVPVMTILLAFCKNRWNLMVLEESFLFWFCRTGPGWGGEDNSHAPASFLFLLDPSLRVGLPSWVPACGFQLTYPRKQPGIKNSQSFLFH